MAHRVVPGAEKKHFTIDDVALIGSSNIDMRSFALNYEISPMMLGPEIVARMRAVEDHYRDLSRELFARNGNSASRGCVTSTTRCG